MASSSAADHGQHLVTPSPSKKLFRYPEIDPETEIRIFELSKPIITDFVSFKTGTLGKSTLRGNFITAKLAKKPVYEALSYAWGELVLDDYIEFPEGVLPITSHLGSALRHLQAKSGPRRLWVDAICIDQSDDSREKGPQVALMASIYQNTDGGIVWLGTGSPITDVSVNLLIRLSRTCAKHGIDAENVSYFFAQPTPLPGQLIIDFNETARRTTRKLSQLAVGELLSHFLEQPWFGRLWIVQEFALPSKLTVVNGTRKVIGPDFVVAILVLNLLIKEESTFGHLNPSMLQTTGNLCAIRVTTQHPGYTFEGSDILELVAKHSDRICREPKDRIYALLGLQGSKTIMQIVPDYISTDENAFKRFAFIHLRRGDLRCLCYAGLTNHKCENSALPSWVPDWTCNETRISSRIGHSFGIPYKACDKVSANIIFEKGDTATIGISGFLLDYVNVAVAPGANEDIGNHLANCGDPWKKIDAIHQWKDLCDNNNDGELKYYTGEDIDAVVARTLVLNNHSHVDPRVTRAGSSRRAGDGMVQWMRRLMCIKQHLNPCVLPECAKLPSQHEVAEILGVVEAVGLGKTLFTTKSGCIGLGPAPLTSGDAVAIFHGAETPFILRKAVTDGGEGYRPEPALENQDVSAEPWQLVGDCYVHGFMDNEILGSDHEGKDKIFWPV